MTDLVLGRNSIRVNEVKYTIGTESKFDDPATLTMNQLDGRRSKINVSYLEVPEDGLILELPESFEKFKVGYFVYWSSDNPLIDRFIDRKSIPLYSIIIPQSLSMEMLSRIEQDEILKTAKHLDIRHVPRELFHLFGTLPNKLALTYIYSGEVFDFLNLIDTMIQQNRKEGLSRCFVTCDVELVEDLYKVFRVLAEDKDSAIFDIEEYEEYVEFDEDFIKCNEFPNEIAFWIDDTMVISVKAMTFDDGFHIWISIRKDDKSQL